jgi:hypothetical protein
VIAVTVLMVVRTIMLAGMAMAVVRAGSRASHAVQHAAKTAFTHVSSYVQLQQGRSSKLLGFRPAGVAVALSRLEAVQDHNHAAGGRG